MQINDDDKTLINAIDEQMHQLLEKGASDDTVLNTLIEFIPDVVCLLQNLDEDALREILSQHQHFAYLCTIIASLNEANAPDGNS